MKRKFLLGLFLLLVPFKTQASVSDNPDGKDIAIVVLACGSAFISGAGLLWWWYTKIVKREQQYNLAHVQENLERTQEQLQITEEQLQQFAQVVGPMVEDTRRINQAVNNAQNRVHEVRSAAFMQLQQAMETTNPDEIWMSMQYGGPPPSYNAPHVSVVHLLSSTLGPSVAEAEFREAQEFGEGTLQ